MGRPSQPSCDFRDDRGHSCLNAARVEVIVTMPNTGSTGQSKVSTLRCWEHYLALENAARSMSTVSVVEAKIYDPKTVKERR